MPEAPPGAPKRVLVGTDRSETADRAVRYAAALANGSQAELVVLHVLLTQSKDGEKTPPPAETVKAAEESLALLARELGGPRGRGIVVIDEDPSAAILKAIERERSDMVVVGNLGMAGRREFLLGN